MELNIIAGSIYNFSKTDAWYKSGTNPKTGNEWQKMVVNIEWKASNFDKYPKRRTFTAWNKEAVKLHTEGEEGRKVLIHYTIKRTQEGGMRDLNGNGQPNGQQAVFKDDFIITSVEWLTDKVDSGLSVGIEGDLIEAIPEVGGSELDDSILWD